MKKLILTLIMFLVIINVASAVTVYGEFENKLNSISINRNQQTSFTAAIFSNNPPINYNIKMYDDKTNLVKTFINDKTNNNLYSDVFKITKEDYGTAGLFTVIINAQDSLNDDAFTTLSLNVINHVPVLSPIGNKKVREGQLLEFKVKATDQDNDVLKLNAVNLPKQATFTDLGNGEGLFRWQTNFEDAGKYNIKFSVSDGLLTSSEEITINVVDVPQNNLPQITINAPRENEVISGIYNVLWYANDKDQPQNTLDIKLEYQNKKASILGGILKLLSIDNWVVLEDGKDNNDGIFTWNTASVNDGNYELRATVRDDQGSSATAYVNFAIKNAITELNHPPKIISKPITEAFVNELYSYKVQATDPDNDVLYYSLVSGPIGMSMDKYGLVTWLPSNKGYYDVTVKVSDGKLEDKQQYIIEVKERSVPPTPVKRFDHHKIEINNIVLKYDNKLNVLTSLENKGNRRENVIIKTIILNNGLFREEKVTLTQGKNIRHLTQFNLPRANYIVRVEITSNHDKDVKYAYVNLK